MDINAASGNITIRVPKKMSINTDFMILSGSIDSKIKSSKEAKFKLSATSTSGNIDVESL